MAAEVYVNNEDDIEKALKKFKKIVDREGILLEVKRRRYYAKPAIEKHEKNKKLERKKKKKLMKAKKLF